MANNSDLFISRGDEILFLSQDDPEAIFLAKKSLAHVINLLDAERHRIKISGPPNETPTAFKLRTEDSFRRIDMAIQEVEKTSIICSDVLNRIKK